MSLSQPSPSMHLPRPGERIAGKYTVIRALARGGMAAVFEAYHDNLEQRVALKVMLEEIAKPEAVARFFNEARAAVRIQNEHVARVLDVDKLPGGLPYMVMEFLDGDDLGQVIDTHGPRPIAEAVDWVLQACEGVAHAHARGVVHRDLKPSNLVLAKSDDGEARVKVVDFGISKAAPVAGGMEDHKLTKTRGLVGSPTYMSPEQIRTPKDVDTRTDVWALGIVLYELLTGAPPHQSESMGEVFALILEHDAPAVSSLRSDVPPGLEAAIARCLQRARDARFESVAAFAEAIAPFGSGAWDGSVERARAALSRQRDASGADLRGSHARSRIGTGSFTSEARLPVGSSPGSSRGVTPPASLDAPASAMIPVVRSPRAASVQQSFTAPEAVVSTSGGAAPAPSRRGGVALVVMAGASLAIAAAAVLIAIMALRGGRAPAAPVMAAPPVSAPIVSAQPPAEPASAAPTVATAPEAPTAAPAPAAPAIELDDPTPRAAASSSTAPSAHPPSRATPKRRPTKRAPNLLKTRE